MFEEGPEQGDQVFTRRQIFFQTHPGTRPAVQIPALVFQVMTWRSGGAVYFGSSRFYQLPLHAATHHDSDMERPCQAPPVLTLFCFRPASRPTGGTQAVVFGAG